ncbi:coiled-coil domain-containing protein [Corynebacterium glutamicum]|nr:hypothetical protein [Corynebacterium glutamicum]NII88216.1 chromosome segregation ATPase [Corynebacterium glutamicum]
MSRSHKRFSVFEAWEAIFTVAVVLVTGFFILWFIIFFVEMTTTAHFSISLYNVFSFLPGVESVGEIAPGSDGGFDPSALAVISVFIIVVGAITFFGVWSYVQKRQQRRYEIEKAYEKEQKRRVEAKRKADKEREDAERKARDDRHYAEKREEERLENIKRLKEGISSNNRVLVDTDNRLVALVNEMNEHRQALNKHFDAPAYGPFWDEVEEVSDLAERVLWCFAHIHELHSTIESKRSELSELESPLALLDPTLTVIKTPDRDAEARSATNTMIQVSKIVYEAQRDPTFAMIAEQRRGANQISSAVRGLYSHTTDLRDKLENVSTKLQDHQKSLKELKEKKRGY